MHEEHNNHMEFDGERTTMIGSMLGSISPPLLSPTSSSSMGDSASPMLSPTSRGGKLKANRRVRTTFSAEQKQALELAFVNTPYPDSAQREKIAAESLIPEARVQVEC